MTSVRSKTIELNEADFDTLIRGALSTRGIKIAEKEIIVWKWHKEMSVRQLQVLRQLIDSAINDFIKGDHK